MRWIDRGPEPDGVQEYRRRLTEGWVRYFRHEEGSRPYDSHWRAFRELLGDRSNGICWYCERKCQPGGDDSGKAPTVDHFRPLRRCPALAYEWQNWVFSCRRCNEEYKKDKWPASGYVETGATDWQERPERYFDYDQATGEIIPRSGLPKETRERALHTIHDLGLNELDVRFYRLDWTRRFKADWQRFSIEDRAVLTQFASSIGREFAGATLMMLQQWDGSPEA